MKDILMYFSNICILGRMENIALEKLKENVKADGINLTVRHFGLGQDYYMNDYFKIDKTLPDIIISTDLEVFENNATFGGLPDEFIDITKRFNLKNNVPKNVLRSDKLLPFLIIPMVFFHNNPDVFNGHTPNLENVIKYNIPITFGGVNNSGAKCILKAVHDKYGFSAYKKLAETATVTKMPIEAFNRVKRGESSLALVPSVYAMRADGDEFFITYPSDGAIALPSYIAVKDKNGKDALRVLEKLLTPEFLNNFVNQGALYCAFENTADPELLVKNNFDIVYPSREYITNNQPDFYDIYKKFIGL